MKKTKIICLSIILCLLSVLSFNIKAQEKPTKEEKAKHKGIFDRRPQIVERDRPAEWKDLVPGGQFMDRFKPMPVQGKLTSDTWGDKNVLPRYTDNGIEDEEYSYWGGNSLLGKDGKYHMIVCRWPEREPKGHGYYSWSDVVHAVSDNVFGPYKVTRTLFPGHNPHLMQLKDGRYMIISGNKFWVETDKEGLSSVDPIEGLSEYWEEYPMVKDNRGRFSPEKGFMAFAQREDDSYFGLTRHGFMSVSKTGYSPYNILTEHRVYPEMEGRFEDPVIWRTNVQYHLIMNDWKGRIAYHMRSKDGLHWKLDNGVAYEPGIGITEDGIANRWAKYEVIRLDQDEYGRAIRANFAAIDCLKKEDLGGDIHSSKVVYFPLKKGRLLSVLNEEKINMRTKEIRLKIHAEDSFNPHNDLDLSSLKFGVSEEVNFGRGCSLLNTEKAGKDLILVFDATGNKITEDHFAGKLIGKRKDGGFVFGYSRLPGVSYLEPLLSAMPARFSRIEGGIKVEVEVQNFGQVTSEATPIKVIVGKPENVEVILGEIPPLQPYEKTVVEMTRMEDRSRFKDGSSNRVIIQIDSRGQKPNRFSREQEILPKKQ